MTEPQDEKLEQRPVGRIWIDDQDGRHGSRRSSMPGGTTAERGMKSV
jgi:hypothetical protein